MKKVVLIFLFPGICGVSADRGEEPAPDGVLRRAGQEWEERIAGSLEEPIKRSLLTFHSSASILQD